MSAVARGVWGVNSAITRGAVASAVSLPAGDVLRLLASTAMMPTATCSGCAITPAASADDFYLVVRRIPVGRHRARPNAGILI